MYGSSGLNFRLGAEPPLEGGQSGSWWGGVVAPPTGPTGVPEPSYSTKTIAITINPVFEGLVEHI